MEGDERTGRQLQEYGFERRLDPRADTDQLIVIKAGDSELVGELLDISASGARLRIRQGLCPAIGQAITMVLIDKTELTGTVAWISGTSIGVAFDLKLLQPGDYLHHDHMGFDYYRTIQNLQARRLGPR